MKFSELMEQHNQAVEEEPVEIDHNELAHGERVHGRIEWAAHRKGESYSKINTRILILDGEHKGRFFWCGLMFWNKGFSSAVDSVKAALGDDFFSTDPDWTDIVKALKDKEVDVLIGWKPSKKPGDDRLFDDHEWLPHEASEVEAY